MRVFVTVGNAAVGFDRLLLLVEKALSSPGVGGVSGVCQYGASTLRPPMLRCVAMLSRGEFETELQTADAVVTHAGVGSLSSAIRLGHRPIVVPRRGNLGEVVNDHQLEIARVLEARQMITVVEDDVAMRSALLAARRAVTHEVVGTSEALAAIKPCFGPRYATGLARGRLLLRLLALAAPPVERLRRR